VTALAWAGLAAISFAAALLQATNGFGFAVLAVPFFLLLAPPGEAIQIVIMLSLAMAAVVVPGVRHAIEPALLARLTIGSLLGLPVGLVAALHADPLIVSAAAGGTIVVFAAALAISRYRRRPAALMLRPGRDMAAGAVAGAATALVGMSGPPVLRLGRRADRPAGRRPDGRVRGGDAVDRAAGDGRALHPRRGGEPCVTLRDVAFRGRGIRHRPASPPVGLQPTDLLRGHPTRVCRLGGRVGERAGAEGRAEARPHLKGTKTCRRSIASPPATTS
jgi:hypothetical protein